MVNCDTGTPYITTGTKTDKHRCASCGLFYEYFKGFVNWCGCSHKPIKDQRE